MDSGHQSPPSPLYIRVYSILLYIMVRSIFYYIQVHRVLPCTVKGNPKDFDVKGIMWRGNSGDRIDPP